MTDSEFVKYIIANNNFYNSSHKSRYDTFSFTEEKNCHDYSAFLIKSSGANFPDFHQPYPWINPGLNGSVQKPEGPIDPNSWKNDQEFQEKVIQKAKKKDTFLEEFYKNKKQKKEGQKKNSQYF